MFFPPFLLIVLNQTAIFDESYTEFFWMTRTTFMFFTLGDLNLFTSTLPKILKIKTKEN